MSIEGLGQYFVAIEDPRCSGKVERRLIEVLVIAVRAVIACAESWDDIALYGRSKLAWLRTFLDLANGIPSHDTFRRVFMLIDPDAFEAGFTKWVGSLAAGFEREVVAIDGKTVRRSFDHGREQSALHVVSAPVSFADITPWDRCAMASKQGLVLGQRCVDGKSNEITAAPELLDQLALQNSIVALDAMGCQTAIAERILARGGDYLLTLKGNHPLAHAAVVEHFDQHCLRVGAPCRADCDAFDDMHGRLVRRRVFASTDAASLEALSSWPGLRTVLAVESIRSVNSAPTKVESEILCGWLPCCKCKLLIWRVGRVQSSVRPTGAVEIGLLALTGSANRVPFCLSGYDALDKTRGVPVPGLTGFAITARRARNLLKPIPQLNRE